MIRRYTPRLILVHPEVEASPITRSVLAHFPEAERQPAESVEEVIGDIRRGRHPETRGKRILFLTRHQGKFLKPCPGICDKATCCDYHVVDLGSNCPLECTYCVLQSHLNNPLMVIYANVDELLKELESALRSSPAKIFRIGTGELTDSLALDAATGITKHLVPFFAAHPNAFLELKTKSTEIENLKDLDPSGQTLVSWSLNTPHIIATEEFKTSSLEERLSAARRCSDWGYSIAFHFDPMVHYPDWEVDYRRTVEMLYEAVPAERIAWISLGTLRFPLGLKSIILQRFPKSAIPFGEMIQGFDGKGRYFRPLRTEMYKKIAGWIRRHNPGQTLYLCMETARVWEQAVGTAPTDHQLAAALNDSLRPATRGLEQIGLIHQPGLEGPQMNADGK